MVHYNIGKGGILNANNGAPRRVISLNLKLNPVLRNDTSDASNCGISVNRNANYLFHQQGRRSSIKSRRSKKKLAPSFSTPTHASPRNKCTENDSARLHQKSPSAYPENLNDNSYDLKDSYSYITNNNSFSPKLKEKQCGMNANSFSNINNNNNNNGTKSSSFKTKENRDHKRVETNLPKMGAGGGRHDHCYTEVHIPSAPHMGVGSLSSTAPGRGNSNVPNATHLQNTSEELHRDSKFTITLKPGQYRVNVQWKSKSQPFRITLTPRQKTPPSSSMPEGPPPLEQQPLFYGNSCPNQPVVNNANHHPAVPSTSGSTDNAHPSVPSLPRRLVHRLLYRSSSPSGRQCAHPSYCLRNSSYVPSNTNSCRLQDEGISIENGKVPTQEKTFQNMTLHSQPCCRNRKGQKRGWDGGPKFRHRKSRYRWASLSCIHMGSLDESLGETSGCDSFGGYEGLEHLKRHSVSRRYSLNQQALARARKAQSSFPHKSFFQNCSKSILWNRPNKLSEVRRNSCKCMNADNLNTYLEVKDVISCSTQTTYEPEYIGISGIGNKYKDVCDNVYKTGCGGGVTNLGEGVSSYKYRTNFDVIEHRRASSKENVSIPPNSDGILKKDSFLNLSKSPNLSQSLSCSALANSNNHKSNLILHKKDTPQVKNDLPTIHERKTWHEDEAFVKQIVEEYFKDPLPMSDFDNEIGNQRNIEIYNCTTNQTLPDLLDELKASMDSSCGDSKEYDVKQIKMAVPKLGSHKDALNGRVSRFGFFKDEKKISLDSDSASSTLSTSKTSDSGTAPFINKLVSPVTEMSVLKNCLPSFTETVFKNLLSPVTQTSTCLSIDDTFCDSDDSTSCYTDDSLGYEADDEPSDKETSGFLFWREWRSAPDVSWKQRCQRYVRPSDAENPNNQIVCKPASDLGPNVHKELWPFATRKSFSAGDNTKLGKVKIGLQKIKPHKLQQFCEENLFGVSKTKKAKVKSYRKRKSKLKPNYFLSKEESDFESDDESDFSNDRLSTNVNNEFKFVSGKYRPALQRKDFCPQIVKDFMKSIADMSETSSSIDGKTNDKKMAKILSHGLVVTHSDLNPNVFPGSQISPAINSPTTHANLNCYNSTLTSQSYSTIDSIKSSTPEFHFCNYQFNNSKFANQMDTSFLSLHKTNSKNKSDAQDCYSESSLETCASFVFNNPNCDVPVPRLVFNKNQLDSSEKNDNAASLCDTSFEDDKLRLQKNKKACHIEKEKPLSNVFCSSYYSTTSSVDTNIEFEKKNLNFVVNNSKFKNENSLSRKNNSFKRRIYERRNADYHRHKTPNSSSESESKTSESTKYQSKKYCQLNHKFKNTNESVNKLKGFVFTPSKYNLKAKSCSKNDHATSNDSSNELNNNSEKLSPILMSSEDSACPHSPPFNVEFISSRPSKKLHHSHDSRYKKCKEVSPSVKKSCHNNNKEAVMSVSAHPSICCKVSSPRHVSAEGKVAPSRISVCQDEPSARSTGDAAHHDTCTVKPPCQCHIKNIQCKLDKEMAKVNIKLNAQQVCKANSFECASQLTTCENINTQIPNAYSMPVDNILKTGDANYSYNTYENISPTSFGKLRSNNSYFSSLYNAPIENVGYVEKCSSSDQGIGDGPPSSGLGQEYVQAQDEDSSSCASDRFQINSQGCFNNTNTLKNNYGRKNINIKSDNVLNSSCTNKQYNNVEIAQTNPYNVQRVQVGSGCINESLQSSKQTITSAYHKVTPSGCDVHSYSKENKPFLTSNNSSLNYTDNINNINSKVNISLKDNKIKESQNSYPLNGNCSNEKSINCCNNHLVGYNDRLITGNNKELNISSKNYKNASNAKNHKSKPHKYFSGILDALSGRASTPDSSKNSEKSCKRMSRKSEKRNWSSLKHHHQHLGNSTGEKTTSEENLSPVVTSSNSQPFSHYSIGTASSISGESLCVKDQSFPLDKSENTFRGEPFLCNNIVTESCANNNRNTSEYEKNPLLCTIHVTNQKNSISTSPEKLATPILTLPTSTNSTTSNYGDNSFLCENKRNDNKVESVISSKCSTTTTGPTSNTDSSVDASYNIPLNSLPRNRLKKNFTVYAYTSNESSEEFDSSANIYENLVFHRSHPFVQQPAETVSCTINLSSNCSSSSAESPSSNFKSSSSSSTSTRESDRSSTNSNQSGSAAPQRPVLMADNLIPLGGFNTTISSPVCLASTINNSPITQDSPSLISTTSNSTSGEYSNTKCSYGDSSATTDSQFAYTSLTEKLKEMNLSSSPQSTSSYIGDGFLNDDDDDEEEEEEEEDDDDSDFSSERLSYCRSASSASLASNASSFYYTAGASTVYEAIRSVSEYISVADDDIPDPAKDLSQLYSSNHSCKKRSKRASDACKQHRIRRSDIECLNDEFPFETSDMDYSFNEETQYVNANVSVVDDKIIVTVHPEVKVHSQNENDDPFVKAAQQYSERNYSDLNMNKLKENLTHNVKTKPRCKSDPTIEDRLPPLGFGSRKKDRHSPFKESRSDNVMFSKKYDIDMPHFVTMRNKSSLCDPPYEITRSQSEKFRDEGKPPAGDSRKGRFVNRRRSAESAGGRYGGSSHTIPSMVVTDSDNRSSIASPPDYSFLPPKPPVSPYAAERSSCGTPSTSNTPDSRGHSSSNTSTSWQNVDSEKTCTHDYYNVNARLPTANKYTREHVYENTNRNYGIRRTRSEEKVREKNNYSFIKDFDASISDDELENNRWSNITSDVPLTPEDGDDNLTEFHRAQKGFEEAHSKHWESDTSLNSHTSFNTTLDDDVECYIDEGWPPSTHPSDPWPSFPSDPWPSHPSDPWPSHPSDPWPSHCSPWDGDPKDSRKPLHEDWFSCDPPRSPSPDLFRSTSCPGQSPSRGKPPRSPSHRGRDAASLPRDGVHTSTSASTTRPSHLRSSSRRRSHSASAAAAKGNGDSETGARPRPRPASLASLGLPRTTAATASQESLFEVRPTPLPRSPLHDVAPHPLWYSNTCPDFVFLLPSLITLMFA